MMKPYRNQSGDSGVVSFEIGPDFINLKFRNNDTVYHYDHTMPGQIHVERMKRLALAGAGLSTWVSQHVRDSYASKE